jgi:dihydroflavonol-4-reductase
MKVLVTGATGFIGSALAKKIAARGDDLVVLVRRDSDCRNLLGLKAEVIYGDLLDIWSVARAVKGCDRVYHAAAEYSLWVPDKRRMYSVNVDGTKNIIEAARRAGVERVVYTSTVGTLGNPGDGTPGTEKTPVAFEDMAGDYKKSKFMAEQVALDYARGGFPVVIVNPSTPVGAHDIKPTPTGAMIRDFMDRRMFAYLDTGLNVVDVDDVAEGHILAMEKGRPGEKYILGNRDMKLREIFELLSGMTGIPAPRIKLPYNFVYPIAYISTAVSDLITRRPPLAPLDAVKMARKFMYFSPEKAVSELGMPQSPVEGALEKAVRWLRGPKLIGKM